MQGSSELVERIIQGAQKYFRGSSEENWGSVRVGCRVLIRCFYFSPPFLMFLSVFFQRSKKAIRHTLRSIFFSEWTVLYWKVFVGIWPGGISYNLTVLHITPSNIVLSNKRAGHVIFFDSLFTTKKKRKTKNYAGHFYLLAIVLQSLKIW